MRLFVVLFLCVIVCSCGAKRTPVPLGTVPSPEASSEEQQVSAQKIVSQLRKQYPLSSDARIDELQEIVFRLTEASKLDSVPWRVHLFEDTELVEVRGIDGYHLLFWTGFLDAVLLEDERAAIIAHEMAHVLAHHVNEAELNPFAKILIHAVSVSGTVALMNVSSGAVVVRAPGLIRRAVMRIADLDPVERDYSEEEEREAAAIALLLLKNAGYSPTATLSFWTRAEEDEGVREDIEPLIRDLDPDERVRMVRELLPTILAKAEALEPTPAS